MDSIFHIQGDQSSSLTPVFLIHAISGFGLPYLNFGALSTARQSRPVYGLSSPIYEKRNYIPPRSLEKMAKEYLDRIRTVRPTGPYIIGGWSLGGMLAGKIAAILTAEGKGNECAHLLLIDAINPQGCPAYEDPKERDPIAEWMFKTYAPQMGLRALVGSPKIEMEQDVMFRALDPVSEDEDDEVDIMEYLPRMRKYIYNSLDIVAGAGPTQFVPEAGPDGIQCTATLIKATILGDHPPGTSDRRKWGVEYRFNQETSGWPMEKLKVIKVDRQHDHFFDADFMEEMTRMIREDLAQVDG
ncbi:MAG: putative secondary metabolism biosynthetic enzyme [Ramalina farinacea]|uniref:Secondary metabolism biosynthetic enzyme n=1 Tax=Ramalina farinacea TaxID=258253 RepID=A0AA43QWD4_9LECA|nr:putative secondary metabolism biosynthetic enzyme [Ramalina farinacea]